MRVERLIDVGGFSSTDEWEHIFREILTAVQSIEWPAGSGEFVLHAQSGKKRGEGNGVKPIKTACMERLRAQGWSLETTIDIATVKRPGPVDATRRVNDGLFCVEWETGNVSSSHRSLNKMALGILKHRLVGGLLIVPTREMYNYLTDRVGNYRELEPYFPLWRSIPATEGLLCVMAIEHDRVSIDVPRIEKGTDGRALI